MGQAGWAEVSFGLLCAQNVGTLYKRGVLMADGRRSKKKLSDTLWQLASEGQRLAGKLADQLSEVIDGLTQEPPRKVPIRVRVPRRRHPGDHSTHE